MPTQRQIDANRLNAQKSTGPKTAAGKAASSLNRLTTGIHAKSLVLPSEKLADLDHLTEEYYHHHNPTTPEARLLVDELIHCEWTLRRLRIAETELWKFSHQETLRPCEDLPLGQSCTRNPKHFSQLQWRVDSTRRAFHRALQALRQIESELPPPPPPPPSVTPSPQTASPQIGFVLEPTAPEPSAQLAPASPAAVKCPNGVRGDVDRPIDPQLD